MRKMYFLLLALVVAMGTQAQTRSNALYVYRNDGGFNVFMREDVDSISLSYFDVDSIRHTEPVCQVFHTPDSAYRIPIAAIDSVSFVHGNQVHMVDLGLSVKWACCNVGASSPEEFGDYFAWGETQPKSSYNDDNCLTYGKYVSELQSEGIIDGNGLLTRAHDAASANWGGSWRMPTEAEIEELQEKCTWIWTQQGGEKGYKVTGPNGNSIFLPAAGDYTGSTLYLGEGLGSYWSSMVYDASRSARYLYFFDGAQITSWDYRYKGFSVRAVSE